MLGRVLSGPALFLMERGGGRWLLRVERICTCGLGRWPVPTGIDGKTAGTVMREAGLMMRGGFSPEKEKAPFQKRWKGAVTGSGARP